MTLQLLSGYEAAVLNVFRREPWRWMREGEIVHAAQTWQRHTKPRTVRYHLRRFVEFGLLERVTDLEPYPPDTWWRWDADAPPGLNRWLEHAAEVCVLHLEPLGTPPARCEFRHDLARHGRIDPDGSRFCLRCVGVVEPVTAT
jgi:hypothetical protein